MNLHLSASRNARGRLWLARIFCAIFSLVLVASGVAAMTDGGWAVGAFLILLATFPMFILAAAQRQARITLNWDGRTLTVGGPRPLEIQAASITGVRVAGFGGQGRSLVVQRGPLPPERISIASFERTQVARLLEALPRADTVVVTPVQRRMALRISGVLGIFTGLAILGAGWAVREGTIDFASHPFLFAVGAATIVTALVLLVASR